MPSINFSKPQQLPILHFPADQSQDAVTSLKDTIIDQNGTREYVYEINLEVDFITAYRNNSFTLIAKACTQLPPTNYIGVSNISFSTPVDRDWSSVIQLQKIRNQEVSDQINNSIFLWTQTISMLSALEDVERSALKAIADADQIFEEERITLKVISGGTAANLGITIEKYDQDTTNIVDNFVFGNANSTDNVNELGVAAKRQDMIYGFLKDPGEFAQKRAANLLTQKFRLNGLVTDRNLDSSYIDIQNNPIFMSLKRSLDSIVSDGKVENDELGVVQVIETYKTKNLKIPFTLKQTEIGVDDFYLYFEVREGGTNQLSQKISVKVPHAENVKYSTFPIETPLVSKISNDGDSIGALCIKQISSNGVFVKIYKKEQASQEIAKNAEFTLIDTIPLSANGNENEIIWEDPTYTPGIYTTYRITSLNSFELESASFASIVLYDSTIKPHDAYKTEVAEKPLHCSLYTTYNRSKPTIMLVHVGNIPWHVCSFTITRKNISNQDEDFVTVASNINIITDQPEKTFTFEDSGFYDRNLYEYCVSFWSVDGIQREATTIHQTVYFYADKESGITNLGSPTITNQGGIDVSFDIIKEKNQYEADFIQQALTLQGNKEEFQTLLNQNSSRLAPIFQTTMYRTQTETGEIESYGIIDGTLFVDSKYGPKNGISAPDSGVKYVYTAITHRRDPETLFYDYIKDNINPITSKTYSYKPAFVSHPVRKREGLIVNEQWLDNEPFDLFTFGDVVDIDQLEITIPFTPPEVVNATSRVIGKDKVLITWVLNGDKTLIDHYVIIMNHNGINTPVGTSRAFNNDSRYEFVDVLDNGEAGIIHYKIIPIYYDYTSSKPIATNQFFFSGD